MATPPRKIFISYRRQDHPEFVERIRDWFIFRYGRDNVFMDFDSIPPMVKFADRIATEVIQCDLMLAIIGPDWMKLLQEKMAGSEEDYVQVEIGLALSMSKPVMPICILGSEVPRKNQLPDDLCPLLDYNAAFLHSGRDFLDNIERVLDAAAEYLELKHPIDLLQLPSRLPNENGIYAIVGIKDQDFEPLAINLDRSGPNFVIVGPPKSGKTTFLQTWIISLAMCYRPRDVALVLIDLQVNTTNTIIAEFPHVLANVRNEKEIPLLIDRLRLECESIAEQTMAHVQIFVFIDNYDELSEIVSKTLLDELGTLARLYNSRGLHFVLCGTEDLMESDDGLKRRVWRSRYSFALQTENAVSVLGGRIPDELKNVELPQGRGFLINRGKTALAQIAVLVEDNGYDKLVHEVQFMYDR